ncbi:MAG: glycoside hydrolase [Candidatus Nitrosotalea sp.]|nr:glycoside hydrolase [Candidatus Nitrosotalea sp.]
MKTLHLSIIVVGIMMIGIFYLTAAFADNIYMEGSGPPRFQLSQIAASGNNVYVVYDSNIDHQDIFFRKSTDGGASFDKIIKITNDNGYASDPHVEVSEESVYLTWFASYPDGNTKVFFEKSTDNGNTFANPIVLDPNGGRGHAVIHTMLAADPNVYMAINYNNLTSLKVNHDLRTSTDNGATFGKPVSIDGSESFYTKIAVSGHNIYVTWDGESVCPHDKCQTDNIFFSKSVDNGATFTKPINLSNTTLAFVPQLAASKNNVLVVWSEDQYPDVLFTKSSDGGSTFSNKINLSKKLGYNSEAPQIAVNGNNVFVSFYHYSNSGANVLNSSQGLYLTKSSDGGNTFGEPIKISSEGNIWASTLDITSGKNVYFSWRAFNITSHRGDVFFAKSGDNNAIDNVINLSGSLEENGNLEPKLAVDGGNVYVGWDVDTPGDNIYFRASNDDGKTFGNIINLNHEIKIPEFPFASLVLLISITSLIMLYRMKFRK